MNKTKSHSSDKKDCVVKKIVVAVILLFFITAVCLFVYSNITINNRMLYYLSEKYSVDKSQITIMEHDKAKLNFEYDFMESTYINYTHHKWICEIENREFEVKFFKFHFVDDYQLEDLEKWCTNYYKENINPNIVGTVIYGNTVFHDPDIRYNNNLPYSDNRLWEEKDIKDFIRYQYLFNRENGISVYVNDIESNAAKEAYSNKISNKLNSDIDFGNDLSSRDVNVFFTDESVIDFQRIYEQREGSYGCQNVLVKTDKSI